MANATDQQVQTWVNERMRVHCEAVRALQIALADDIATIDDVYNALATSPTWSDNRSDGPPHLLVPNDVLAFNTFIRNLNTAITGDAQWPIVQKACVRAA